MILRHVSTSHHMNFLTEVFEGFFVTILITILVTIFVTEILLRKRAPDFHSLFLIPTCFVWYYFQSVCQLIRIRGMYTDGEGGLPNF